MSLASSGEGICDSTIDSEFAGVESKHASVRASVEPCQDFQQCMRAGHSDLRAAHLMAE